MLNFTILPHTLFKQNHAAAFSITSSIFTHEIGTDTAMFPLSHQILNFVSV